VFQRLFRGDGGELIQRELAEGATGGRQPDGLYLSVCAYAQTLVDGVVLAIDGQDGHVALTGGASENFARSDHAFLVGKAEGFAGENSCVGGFQTRHADDGRYDKIRFRQG
jgi:hypothetical protein